MPTKILEHKYNLGDVVISLDDRRLGVVVAINLSNRFLTGPDAIAWYLVVTSHNDMYTWSEDCMELFLTKVIKCHKNQTP